MRDLDELLDPVVSRRASAAARTTEFAVVERRGRRLQRRARAVTIAAMLVLVAGIGAVGAQVVPDRSDSTAPAATIEYEGPDGELATAIEAGWAEVDSVQVMPDGSRLIYWRRAIGEYGFTLTSRGETRWSPILPYGESYATPLLDGAAVIHVSKMSRTESTATNSTYYVADSVNVRPIDVTEQPFDPESHTYEGFTPLYGHGSFRTVYAIDSETATASPVPLPRGVAPEMVGEMVAWVATGEDGTLWMANARAGGLEFVSVGSDGDIGRYTPEPAVRMRDIVGATVSPDGRPVVVSARGLRQSLTLYVSTVHDGAATTYEVANDVRLTDWVANVAVLADARLLIGTKDAVLRSTDASWQQSESLGVPEGTSLRMLRRAPMERVGDEVCFEPGVGFDPLKDIVCTTDGESWAPVDVWP